MGPRPRRPGVLARIPRMGCEDPILRQRVADLYTEMAVLRLLNQRV
ncbi:MAG: hypothetical protein CM1200mP26_07090 [Acidimicrobiales bacterium]|nr:MAG: hypothetical protein CM1200mP26_07090 [Acidimicrobiales bacterium]